MPYKKETVRICVRHSGEKRNAARGEKQEFPGNLPGTAVLGPLHDGGEKFLVPVFGEDKKGLINDLLCASVRAALCQPEYCCQQPQFEGADVLRLKRLFRGQHAGNMVREHAHHCVRDLLCHVQLMQAYDDRKALFMGQLLQDGQQLDLALDVQKGGGLVQQQHFRLLADGTGQQNTLTLTITDAVEVPVREMRSSGNFQCILHGLPVGVG